MHRLKLWLVISFLALFIIFPLNVFAERVKPLNPDCDVCPVVICYDGDEAKGILGKAGIQLLLKLKEIEKKTIKIDLDGLKKIGSEKDSDEGYELLVFGYKHLISINSIRYGAVIKIRTDYRNLNSEGVSNSWTPEIHLKPDNNIQIEKDDDLETAWNKFKKSPLYHSINNNSMDHSGWTDNLRKMVLHVLENLTR
jgi:hypothetical protein